MTKLKWGKSGYGKLVETNKKHGILQKKKKKKLTQGGGIQMHSTHFWFLCIRTNFLCLMHSFVFVVKHENHNKVHWSLWLWCETWKALWRREWGYEALQQLRGHFTFCLFLRSDSDSEGENPEKKKLQEQLMGQSTGRDFISVIERKQTVGLTVFTGCL